MQKYTKQNCILEFGISVFYNVEDSSTQSFHSFKKIGFCIKIQALLIIIAIIYNLRKNKTNKLEQNQVNMKGIVTVR